MVSSNLPQSRKALRPGPLPPLSGPPPPDAASGWGRQDSPYGVLSLEAEIVSDHRDKFAVRRFSLDAADGVAEEALERLHVAAVPRDLDGMADGALNA